MQFPGPGQSHKVALRCLAVSLVITGALGVSAAIAASVTEGLRSGISSRSAVVARGIEGCAEPQFIDDTPGTVGQSFSLVELVDCLPHGEKWSSALIHWGDGTTSPGVITADNSELGNVTVEGQHVYSQPGGFSIRISVTDQAGQTYEGGWHTNAAVSAPILSPPSSPSPPSTPSPAPPAPPVVGHGIQEARTSAHGRAFTALRDVSRWRVVAAVSTTLTAARVRASISWGDGTVSRGVFGGSPPDLTISGRHRWRRPGRYLVVVTATLTYPGGRTHVRAVSHVDVRIK